MKIQQFLFIASFVFFYFWMPDLSYAQCDRERDSLVLMDIVAINPTLGPMVNWGSGLPLTAWDEIEVNQDGCVITIDLFFKFLDSLPSSIGELSALEELSLEVNNITYLPESIGNLGELKRLDLSLNRIEELPRSIGNLNKLLFLDVAVNQIKELPPTIGDLGSLEELQLSLNQIPILPDELTNLNNLRILHLAGNRFYLLPSLIGDLGSLEDLQVSLNAIEFLPDGITNLTNLKILDIGFNRIKKLPSNLGILTNLESLDLEFNQISILPESIGELNKLKILNAENNDLSEVPESIGEISNLQELILANNLIAQLPATFSRLSSLTHLDLRKNELSEFPEFINNLTVLQFLDLNSNYIPVIPTWIGNLSFLEYLAFGDNRVSLIPETIGNLRSLGHLDASKNDILIIPESIGNLRSLDQLYLNDNRINSIPTSFNNLRRLDSLSVSNNLLTFSSIKRIRDYALLPKTGYSPQKLFFQDTVVYLAKGNTGTINLDIDGSISESEYRWFKNGSMFIPDPVNNINSNTLVIPDVDLSDVGIYQSNVTNPNYSQLTLESHPIRIRVCDRVNDSLQLVRLYENTNGPGWSNNTGWIEPNVPIEDWVGITTDHFGCVNKIELSGNDLNGTLPGLQLNTLDTIILNGNNITGGIPNDMYIPFVKYVDLSSNSLSGRITEVVSSWMLITNLNLSENQLRESIPPEIGDLCELEELEMNGNGFEGEIPTELTMLVNLKKGQVNFANNEISSMENDWIYFCPFGVEIMAENPGGFERFVEICGDICSGMEFNELSDFPWLIDTLQTLDCEGEGCYNRIVRSDAGFAEIRGINVAYTRTRCYSDQNSYEETISFYDCGGFPLDKISCNSNGTCSFEGIITEADLDELNYEVRWSCSCTSTSCVSRDTVKIEPGQTDTLSVEDYLFVSESCNPGFYTLTSVDNELPGTPPIVTEDNIGFTYELLTENLISGQQCTTTIEVVRGSTGRNEFDPEDPSGPVTISCHPNPVVDFLRCPEIDMVNVEEYKVYNLQGMEMPNYVENYKDKLQLNVQDYPSGMYILLVKTKDRQYLNRFSVIH